MKRKKRISQNPLTYVVLILILLLLIVFIVSLFDKKPSDDTFPSGGTDNTEETSYYKVIIDEDGGTGENNGTKTSDSTETEEEVADNAWAMFLVNNQNPLPDDYDDTLERDIGMTLVYEDYRDYYMDSRAAPYVLQMLEDSAEDGVDLYIVSTYRTQEYQQQNLDNSVQDRINQGMDYDAAYADAIASVALPGCSEHNAGLAADIMTPAYTSMNDDGFKNTPEYEWLSENAHKYGFILRYPEGKQDVTGIIYEPWHYRFIGVYYATKVRESGLTLEEYFKDQGWVDTDGKATSHLGPFEPPAEDENTPPVIIVDAPADPNVSTVTVNTDSGEPIVVE